MALTFLSSFVGAAMNGGCTVALQLFNSACAINRAVFLDKKIMFRYNLFLISGLMYKNE